MALWYVYGWLMVGVVLYDAIGCSGGVCGVACGGGVGCGVGSNWLVWCWWWLVGAVLVVVGWCTYARLEKKVIFGPRARVI